jgi:peptidoglycan-N-acetylglucosamine deacetylase
MKYQHRGKSLIVILLLCLGAAAQSSKPSRKMAVTFDDLPYAAAGQSHGLSHAQRATNKLLRVLKSWRVPAVAFVNESGLQVTGEVDARIALLQQWVDAGAILGNHTYSHPDFNTLTIEQFEDEIIKGEVVTRWLMRSHEPYQLYFRHPMTHTGNTQAKKEAIENFLAARGYKVTPHTIENSDFIFNAIYVDALHDHDEAMARRLRTEYLDFTIAATEFAERFSPQIFGREVTQTLLIHANNINADCLDEMLKRFARRGYRFVTLDEAMNDPAYKTRDTYVTTFGPTWLWRWMKSKGMNLSFKGDPDPPRWVMDLFKKKVAKLEFPGIPYRPGCCFNHSARSMKLPSVTTRSPTFKPSSTG